MRYACLCAGVLFLSLIPQSFAEPPPSVAAPPRSFRDTVIHAKNSAAAGKALRDLFKKSSDESLLKLKADPHLTVALHAAHWMQGSSNPRFVASSHPERFIGLLEGRTGLTCPPNWASSFVMAADQHPTDPFLSGAAHTYGALGLVGMEDFTLGLKPGEAIPSQEFEIHPYRSLPFNNQTVNCPSTIDIKNGRFFTDKHSTPIHSTLLNALNRHKSERRIAPSHLNLLVRDDRVFVVAWDVLPSEFAVFCLDANPGHLLWVSTVWAMHSESRSLIGAASHLVELAANEQQIGIFGITGDGNYVEAFDVKTGDPVFRFNSRLWNAK